MFINVDFIYPVGSIYETTVDVNPGVLFGGTWERITGRFLLGVGAPQENTNLNHGSVKDYLSWYFPSNETGGEYYHKLTVAELAKHSHTTYMSYGGPLGGNSVFDLSVRGVTNNPAWSASLHNANTGGDAGHNNIPPYYTVYIWKRVG